MTLQARLTIWSLLVMTSIVLIISGMDLTNEIDRQFEVSLRRTESIWRLASSAVNRSVLRSPALPVPQRVQGDPGLTREFRELLNESGPVVAIAVCDSRHQILNSADTSSISQPFPGLDDFRRMVRRTRWWNKLLVLTRDRGHYSYSGDLNAIRVPQLTLSLMVDPVKVREELAPSMQTHLVISFASIAGAILVTLIFSTIAFRPLSRLGQMLDLVAKGEYELQQVPKKRKTMADQFGIVESKVSMLGEQLRGAQSEFSDLRGNVERLLDELEDAVFIFGRDRRLIAAAGAVNHFLDRPRAELIGLPLAGVFPPGTSLGLLLAQAAQNARPVRNRRVPLNHSDGSNNIFLALLSVEFLDASAAGMVIRLRDPEATKQIGRQLQTADRLSAISRLTGGVAHEVKNPLNAMLMHVELAKMKLNHGDYDVNPQMEVISSEILRLDRVVKTFLDFTRPVALKLIEAPLANFIEDIAELARPQAEAAGIALTVKQSEENVAVTVDSDLLKQALLNIVVNAIEAMPEGGELRIESGVRGDMAEIRITDTGPGIPADLRDKIYNLYFTTKTQGSGIGLAMTFRIVQLHDGRIGFTSETGKGTSFTVELPLAMEIS